MAAPVIGNEGFGMETDFMVEPEPVRIPDGGDGAAEATDDQHVINVKDAYIRDSNWSKEKDNPVLLAGTVIKVLKKHPTQAGYEVEVVEAPANSTISVGETCYTWEGNFVQIAENVDNAVFYEAYSDSFDSGGPIESTDGEGPTSYSVTKQSADGTYVQLSSGTTVAGWAHRDSLFSKEQLDRRDYMLRYARWLEAQLQIVNSIEGQSKLDLIRGHLSQVESTFHQIETGTFPPINDLSVTPDFEAHDYHAKVAPEVIDTVRKFIDLTEISIRAYEAPAESTLQGTEADATTGEVKATPKNIKTSEDSVKGGSLYSSIDWHSRLGVPRYRTQTDNLLPPVTTCSPTSFAMAAERMGYTRADVVATIDELLTDHRSTKYRETLYNEAQYRLDKFIEAEGVQETNRAKVKVDDDFVPDPGTAPSGYKPSTPMPANYLVGAVVPRDYTPSEEVDEKTLNSKWEAEVTKFLNGVTGNKEWKKVRSGSSGGSIHLKSAELAKGFRENAQMEDLVYLLATLVGTNKKSSSRDGATKILPALYDSSFETNADAQEVAIENTAPSNLTPVIRRKIESTLNNGGAVVLNWRHKGIDDSDGHIVTVRAVTHDGLQLDDPFGVVNPAYERRRFSATEVENKQKTYDAYKATGGRKTRGNYNNRNKLDYHTSESDYWKRDFGFDESRSLDQDEQRGRESKLSWEQFNDSKDLITGITYYTVRPTSEE